MLIVSAFAKFGESFFDKQVFDEWTQEVRRERSCSARSTYGEVDWLKYTSSTVTNPLFEEKITARDGLGRIKTREERVLPLSGPVQVTTYDYTYDGAGRLWKVKENGTLVREYGFDANGNRTSTKTYTNGVLTHTAYGVYDDQDRMTSYDGASYGYDGNGRLSTKTPQGGLTTTYVYDVFGNLRSVALPGNGTVSYTIDPANRRIARTKGVQTTERLVFLGRHPVAQLTDDGSDWKRHFVYSSRGHVPDIMYEKTSSGVDVYRLVTDHLGSLRMVVKLDGSSTPSVVQRMSYDEWGNVVQDEVYNGFSKVPFGYAGGLYDRETGLVRFGARDYDAESGRWTAKDPLGFGGGDGDVYAYVAGDPVNAFDPSGLLPEYSAYGDQILAAWDALKDAREVSRDNGGREAGGVIYTYGDYSDRSYYYSFPILGDAKDIDGFLGNIQVPSGATIVGWYHTHPGNSGFSGLEGDQGVSVYLLRRSHEPTMSAWLATGDGHLWEAVTTRPNGDFRSVCSQQTASELAR